MEILVDTREQCPIWYNKKNVIVQKLNVGDYTTRQLLNKAHAERKSPNDLYGSIIQNHERFRAEINRARDSDITLAVFVECTKEVFYNKRWFRAKRLKTSGEQLKKIVETISNKYCIDFIFCLDREDMRARMILWFFENGETTGNC